MAKILVAFDDSDNAMRAVNFVASHFSRDSEVTIFSVLEDTQAMCAMNSPELTPYFKAEQHAFCILADKKRDLVDQAMQTAKKALIDSGFAPDRIRGRMEKRSKGVARDIIREADSGYDVVVIGKKGVSALKEFFFGSVAQKVLHGVQTASVLAVS